MSEVLVNAAEAESRSLLFNQLDTLSFASSPAASQARLSEVEKGGATKLKGKRSKSNVGADDFREAKKRNVKVNKDVKAAAKPITGRRNHDVDLRASSGVLSTPPTLSSGDFEDLIVSCKQQQSEQQHSQQSVSPKAPSGPAACLATKDEPVAKRLDLDQESGRDAKTTSCVLVTSPERLPQSCNGPADLDELAFKSKAEPIPPFIVSSNLESAPCIEIIDDELLTDNSPSAALAKAPEVESAELGSGGEGLSSKLVEQEGKVARRPAKKYRQAAEKERADGSIDVQVLCSQCRRDTQSKRQMSLSEFMPRSTSTVVSSQNPVLPDLMSPPELAAELNEESKETDPADVAAPTVNSEATVIPIVGNSAEQSDKLPVQAPELTGKSICHRCRRSLVVDHATSKGLRGSKATVVGCPLTAKLKQYQRGAQETRAEWGLRTAEAFALMRSPCSLCGVPADPQAGRFNGITRLRATCALRSMGPYAAGNVATACSMCNMMKGTHTLVAIFEICRSIATHRGLGSFGHFPERFVNNTSRKSRSSYLGDTSRKASNGTVQSKTHSLTNAQFNSIVANPCHYCGKVSDPPHHYNGLDRLDNSLRVYNMENAVSCCGTCNMAKGKFTEDDFLKQCAIIAARAVTADSSEVDKPPPQGSGGDTETAVTSRPAEDQDMACTAGIA